MDISERIRIRMRELRMLNSQGTENVKKLADKATVPYATANALVRGKTDDPGIHTVHKVAKALRVSVNWLLGETEFDERAYERGKAAVADAVSEAVQRAMAPTPTPEASTPGEPDLTGIPTDTRGTPGDGTEGEERVS